MLWLARGWRIQYQGGAAGGRPPSAIGPHSAGCRGRPLGSELPRSTAGLLHLELFAR
jgi:hypothetical protein